MKLGVRYGSRCDTQSVLSRRVTESVHRALDHMVCLWSVAHRRHLQDREVSLAKSCCLPHCAREPGLPCRPTCSSETLVLLLGTSRRTAMRAGQL
jgi:hypothetical protein